MIVSTGKHKFLLKIYDSYYISFKKVDRKGEEDKSK